MASFLSHNFDVTAKCFIYRTLGRSIIDFCSDNMFCESTMGEDAVSSKRNGTVTG